MNMQHGAKATSPRIQKLTPSQTWSERFFPKYLRRKPDSFRNFGTPQQALMRGSEDDNAGGQASRYICCQKTK
eukprot:COSAG02_NODE_2550_length_8554_cov_67.309639_12_plen_73_part_00